jgi:hypothetical protein
MVTLDFEVRAYGHGTGYGYAQRGAVSIQCFCRLAPSRGLADALSATVAGLSAGYFHKLALALVAHVRPGLRSVSDGLDRAPMVHPSRDRLLHAAMQLA